MLNHPLQHPSTGNHAAACHRSSGLHTAQTLPSSSGERPRSRALQCSHVSRQASGGERNAPIVGNLPPASAGPTAPPALQCNSYSQPDQNGLVECVRTATVPAGGSQDLGQTAAGVTSW